MLSALVGPVRLRFFASHTLPSKSRALVGRSVYASLHPVVQGAQTSMQSHAAQKSGNMHTTLLEF